MTGATIFSNSLPATGGTEERIQLTATVSGNSVAPTWTSSDTRIATVDETGLVVATGVAGRATITSLVQDGSNKRASVAVTVVVPASYLTITTRAPLMEYGTPTIACGKSVANSVSYGDAYGVPTVKTAAWSFRVYEIWYETVSGQMVERSADVTNVFLANKKIKLSSSGTLASSRVRRVGRMALSPPLRPPRS